MELLQRFEAFISCEHLFNKKDRLLIGVSGGVDSVVLCELCHQAGYSFAIAHANFQLRGAESERDAAFVQGLAKKYNVPFFTRAFETKSLAEEFRMSVQVAARVLRYGWFSLIEESGAELARQPDDQIQQQILRNSTKAAQKEASAEEEASRLRQAAKPDRPFQYVLTAHHLNDNVETMLMNFFKGTGITGLRGILPKQGSLVRPLLFATKEELLQFASASNLQWVEDSSNAQDKYSRNYFRHQIIPLIQQLFPAAESNLADNLARFRDIEILYKQAVTQHLKKLLEYKDAEVHIPVLKLKKTEPVATITYEIIKDFGFSAQQVPEVLALLESSSGKYVESSSHRIIRNRQWLIIAPQAVQESRHILIESSDTPVGFATGTLMMAAHDAKDYSLPADNSVAALDAGLLQFPLLLRPWKQGDYFYPLGMKKKKKLARFFIDQKLSKTDKEKIWVLEMNKKIIWVVGLRIDERFKLSPATERVLQVTFTPA